MMKPAAAIRNVTAFDAAVLAALHKACFTERWDQRWTAQSFSEILAMPGAVGWIAAIGADPIGFAVARIAADEAELLLIGILPDCRRAQRGKTLFDQVLMELHKAGASRVFLEVAERNPAAVAFYRKAGFHDVGRRPGYYRSGDVESPADAIVMTRALVDRGAAS